MSDVDPTFLVMKFRELASDSWAQREHLYEAIGPLVARRDWDGLDALAVAAAGVILPEASVEADESVRGEYGAALDATVEQALEQAASFAETTPVKVMYSEHGDFGHIGLFACDRDESDSSDWPAYFVTDVEGPSWEPLLSRWEQHLEEALSGDCCRDGWCQLWHLVLLAAAGRAWHRRERDMPFFFAEHDQPIIRLG